MQYFWQDCNLRSSILFFRMEIIHPFSSSQKCIILYMQSISGTSTTWVFCMQVAQHTMQKHICALSFQSGYKSLFQAPSKIHLFIKRLPCFTARTCSSESVQAGESLPWSHITSGKGGQMSSLKHGAISPSLGKGLGQARAGLCHQRSCNLAPSFSSFPKTTRTHLVPGELPDRHTPSSHFFPGIPSPLLLHSSCARDLHCKVALWTQSLKKK